MNCNADYYYQCLRIQDAIFLILIKHEQMWGMREPRPLGRIEGEKNKSLCSGLIERFGCSAFCRFLSSFPSSGLFVCQKNI